MSARKLSMSFSGGEVTPEFWGQISDAKFQSGLASCRNMIVLPHGPVINRAGTTRVVELENSNTKSRLIPFTYSTTQTMVIELAPGGIRFHTQGVTLQTNSFPAYNGSTAYVVGDMVSSAGFGYVCTANTTGNPVTNGSYWSMVAIAPYKVASPYSEADLFDIKFVQSADILTLTHPNYPPKELRRYASRWELVTISFASTLAAPSSMTATATTAASPSGLTTQFYGVTSVSANGLEESAGVQTSSCINNLLQTGAYNTLAWSTTGATRYNVYKQSNGLYAYIGQTDGLTFKDDNITPNLAKTTPIGTNPFANPGYYPGAVSYFEQRRCFAGSINEPQNLRMTRSGTESNMTYSIPSRDDDSINVRVAAREANTIRHIVPLSNLVLLTGSAEWRVTSINSDAITPNSISVKPQSYIGASNVQPVIVNNNIIYGAARGGHMREMAYNFQAGGYVTGDLSLRAPHLFDNLDVVDIAYAKAPVPILWAVSTSGKLLGMTYVPEQQIGAWHQHDTVNGSFESCCVVSEGKEDVLYVVVRRLLNGTYFRFIERMASRAFATQADAYFVDCGFTFNGAPATNFTGMTWLEGQTVNILGDGAEFTPRVVQGGAITLDHPCSKVTVGLPITAVVQTLPLTAQVDAAYGQGRLKNINKVWLRVFKSSGFAAGPYANKLREFKQRTNETYGTPTKLATSVCEIVLDPSWQDDGQIMVQQDKPLPLTLVSMTVEAELGG